MVAGVDHIEAPLRDLAELLLAHHERLFGSSPLDTLRQDVCCRLDEVDVVTGKDPAHPRVGPEHPVRRLISLDDDADAAHDLLVPEEGRAAEPCFGPEVIDNHRFPGEKRISCLGIGSPLNPSHAGLGAVKPDSRLKQEHLLVGEVPQHLDVLDPQVFGHRPDHGIHQFPGPGPRKG